MTLGELLTREGITLSNHDRNRIGLLIGTKANELGIVKAQKAERNGDKHYKANDYDEAFAGDMLVIVKEFLSNTLDSVSAKKNNIEKVAPVVHVQSATGKIKQQEWLAKRKAKLLPQQKLF